MAGQHLSIPSRGVEPNLELVVINDSLWVFVGHECRSLSANDAALVGEFATAAAEALGP